MTTVVPPVTYPLPVTFFVPSAVRHSTFTTARNSDSSALNPIVGARAGDGEGVAVAVIFEVIVEDTVKIGFWEGIGVIDGVGVVTFG